MTKKVKKNIIINLRTAVYRVKGICYILGFACRYFSGATLSSTTGISIYKTKKNCEFGIKSSLPRRRS